MKKLTFLEIKELFSQINQRTKKIKILQYFAKKNSWKKPILIGVSGGIIVFTSIFGLYFNTTTVATYVIINGQRIGLVAAIDDGKDLVDHVLSERGKIVGHSAKTHDLIQYESVRVKKSALLTDKLTNEKLDNRLSSYVDAVELDIQGTKLAVLPTQEDVDKLLEEYKNFYSKPSADNKVNTVQIVEPINTKQVEIQADEIDVPDEILKDLAKGKTSETEYTVQPNDSWWLIARKNNMRVNEVLAGNPGATEDSVIKPGQKIKLVSVIPYLTVMSKGTITEKETIPFDVITKTDYNLASGKTKIKQNGSDGSKVVTYSYVRKNGEDISKNVLDEKVIKAAVDQVIAKGPSRAPVSIAANVSRGSGKISGISWPLQGHINSYYGYRGSDFHTGIDIGGSTGQPYYAAASGSVVAAGWDGGYGNMILIDHGNGVTTRYAHSSKIEVKVGQHVNKGQEIGLVGSTGNSTGSHLHFEIIINGDTVNPLNYLP